MALVGVRGSEELKENVAAVEWRLAAEDCEQIDRVFAADGVPTHVDTPQSVEPFYAGVIPRPIRHMAGVTRAGEGGEEGNPPQPARSSLAVVHHDDNSPRNPILLPSTAVYRELLVGWCRERYSQATHDSVGLEFNRFRGHLE